jgi:hypothetical protein
MKHHKNKQTGFALLMTLIIVGVVISVGLSILDLTIKQLKLSTSSKDSEIALHAANAGHECAQYWRNHDADSDGTPEIEVGAINFQCFGLSNAPTAASGPVPFNAIAPVVPSVDSVQKYIYEFTWGSDSNRCTRITMLLFASDNTSGGISVTGSNMFANVPGYTNATKSCEPGGRCAVTSVQGYNRACPNVGSHGTIQREVLLES